MVFQCDGHILGEQSGDFMYAENGDPLLLEGGSCWITNQGKNMIISIVTSQAGLVGVLPSLAYINTSDTIATVTTAGYLNKEVANGFSFSLPCMAIVATKTSPTAASVTGTYNVSFDGTNWSLTAV